MNWINIPRFELLRNDDMWNMFECIEEGWAVYTDSHKCVISLRFEVGWKTDISSTPSWARSFLSQTGPHSPAALVHDKALEMGLSRKIARNILKDQLKYLDKMSKFKKMLMITGITLYDFYRYIF